MVKPTPTKHRTVGRDTIRSRLVLEVASELVDRPEWSYRQARVDLREQGGELWPVCLLGSDGPAAIDQVARGEVQVAIINPAGPLALALRGTGPFKNPIPLRAITVIPSPDQLAFAVTERTGLNSLRDIRKRRFPLRISIRGQMDHSLHLVVKEVLAAAGFSLDDVVSWGGQVRYDPGLPNSPTRLGAVQRGEVDMLIDEAVRSWVNAAVESDMRILPFDEALLEQLEGLGFRRAVISKARYTKLKEDVPTLDFSGFPVYTHVNVPDTIVSSICSALEVRKEKIPWQEEGPLPLDRMCHDTPEGPLNIPLHPAAERFWRERGYLA
ncbi:MAG TPA: TAXI family TRAP transporter solute-binding subunit [Candidatus Binatia bacterium]|nr:TAXI family TRAP transporter solute-binding subunit [Candidatus Binatia bacterium]